MDQLMKFLHEAAAEGNIQSLFNLLEKDRFILDRCMAISYAETPLHIAALLGHLDFCKELLRLKSELAEELDSRKSSALHLAAGRGFTEIVKLLASVGPKMWFSFDEDGKIPLHVAAMKGRVEVLKELLYIIVNYLVQNTKIDVYGVNLSGLTALDILSQTRRDSKYIDISHCLHNYASQSSKIIPLSSQVVEPEIEKSGNLLNKHTRWLETQRNTLMILASLIATIGFQAALTPPGGFTQEDHSGNNNTMVQYHIGKSIFADKNPYGYKVYMVSNTTGFISSLSIILLLLSGIPRPRKVFMWIMIVIMWISLSAMAFTYMNINNASSTEGMELFKSSKIVPYIIVGWLMIVALLIMVHSIPLISYIMKSWNSKIRVFIWILLGTVFILVASVLSYYTVHVVHGDLFHVDGDLYQVPKTLFVQCMILFLVILGWFVLWMVFGLTALIRIIVITTKKLIRCVVILAGTVCIIVKKLIKRIGVIMTSSRSLDNFVVV